MMSELLTPAEWCEHTGIRVLDPDGWRIDGRSWDEPIDEAEFKERVWSSTISCLPGAPDHLAGPA